ncbi:MAG TPA: hypothetical protein VNT76_11355, partial [Candidatus Binatus sp.]|nr:hypothetical protein [Candidatus Binatus sp.]
MAQSEAISVRSGAYWAGKSNVKQSFPGNKTSAREAVADSNKSLILPPPRNPLDFETRHQS